MELAADPLVHGGSWPFDLALQSPVATFTAMYFRPTSPAPLVDGGRAAAARHGRADDAHPPDSSRRTKTFFLAILNSRPFRVISHPIPTWFLYLLRHVRLLPHVRLGFAMEHMWVMDLINIAFLFGATCSGGPSSARPDPALAPEPRDEDGQPAHRRAGRDLPRPGPLSAARSAAPMYSLASTHAGGASCGWRRDLHGGGLHPGVFISWMRGPGA